MRAYEVFQKSWLQSASPPSAHRLPVKDLVITILGLAAIAACMAGAADLLGIGVNSMTTLRGLMMITGGYVFLLFMGYLATPNYREVERYLPQLKEKEYTLHRGADAKSPLTLMVSVRHDPEGPSKLVNYHVFLETISSEREYVSVFLKELRTRAEKS